MGLFLTFFKSSGIDLIIDMSNLNDIKINCSAVIIRLDCEGKVRQRFFDLGIFKGVEIKVKAYAPLFDPIIIEVKGSLMAIRRSDAKKIIIDNKGAL